MNRSAPECITTCDHDTHFTSDSHRRPHHTIHTPFWGLTGITQANGSSWN